MSPVAVLDALTVLGWLAVVCGLLARWSSPHSQRTRWVLLGLGVFSLFYSLCLLAEWSGLTHRLERVEDLFGITLPIWWLFAFYALTDYLRSRDLAEREADLRRAQTIAGIGSWHLDPDASSLDCSEEVRHLFGHPADQPLTRRDIMDAVCAEDRLRVALAWDAALAGAPYDLEYRLDVGARTIWVHERAEFQLGNGSTPPRARGTIQNITSRVTTEQERATLQEELNQAQKMEAIGQLAGGVAHDFNNLLTVIMGNVENLQSMLADDPRVTRPLEDILHAAEQATGVTRALLTFSHQLPSEPRSVDVAAIVETATKLLRRLLPSNIELEVALPIERPVLVCADATQLQQVVLNLAINARDAMPTGGRLRVALTRIPPDPAPAQQTPPRVAIAVSDTGSGMPPDVRARIFEPFFTTKGRGQGTGLGLAIVKTIVTGLGGKIHVDSAPGRGSTFEVHLLAETAAAAPDGTPAAPVAATGSGELILVAENNAEANDLMVARLRAQGYQVHPFDDGAALLAAFQDTPASVAAIVTDLDLPGRRGTEIVAEIRSQGHQLPVILITGSVEPSLEKYLIGDTTLVRKPLQLDLLARTVGDVLSRLRESETHS